MIIDEAFVCIVNYGAAIEGEDVTYAEEGGRIEVKSDSGDYLEVLAELFWMKDTFTVYVQSRTKAKNLHLKMRAEL